MSPPAPKFRDRSHNTIAVLDLATDTVTGAIALPVPNTPMGIAIAPDGATAWVTANNQLDVSQNKIRFLKSDGAPVVQTRTLAATSRTTIAVNTVSGLEATTFSTVVTSTGGAPLVVERTMRWDASGYGAHSEKATAGAASTWYFAEGAHGLFSTFLLLANPANVKNTAQNTWLREGEPALERSYSLEPGSRYTVEAGADPELAGRAFGARVTFTEPGMAERRCISAPLRSGQGDMLLRVRRRRQRAGFSPRGRPARSSPRSC